MTPRCISSKFSTTLESNTIYMGKSLSNKYNCPDSLCAEHGSFSRPAQTFTQVLNIIKKNFKNIPVSISIFSGEYREEDIFEYSIFNHRIIISYICFIVNTFSNYHLKFFLQLYLSNNHLVHFPKTSFYFVFVQHLEKWIQKNVVP